MKREEENNAGDFEMQLQSALHFSVGQLCLSIEQKQEREMQIQTNLEKSTSSKPSNSLCAPTKTYVRMSTDAISTLTELTFQYVTTSLANDLVSFSKHANRRTISVDDVKLVARKEPTKLLYALQNFEKNISGNNHISTNRMQDNANKTVTKDQNQIFEINSSSSDSSKSIQSSSSEFEVDLDVHFSKNERNKKGTVIRNDRKRRRMIDVQQSYSSDTIDEVEVDEKRNKFILSSSSSDDEP